MFIEKIKTRVCGIPCLIGVSYHHCTPPWRGSPLSCDSDSDYYGYTESDWRILDSRGRIAEWLERKLKDEDRRRIEAEIDEYFEEEEKWHKTEAAIAHYEDRY